MASEWPVCSCHVVGQYRRYRWLVSCNCPEHVVLHTVHRKKLLDKASGQKAVCAKQATIKKGWRLVKRKEVKEHLGKNKREVKEQGS